MMYQQYQSGWIEVISGCMFAGKTEELIRRIKTLQYGKKKIKVFKPRIDNRYAIDEIASHSGYKVSCICIDDANDILKYIEDDDDVVCVDEAHTSKCSSINQILNQNFLKFCKIAFSPALILGKCSLWGCSAPFYYINILKNIKFSKIYCIFRSFVLL